MEWPVLVVVVALVANKLSHHVLLLGRESLHEPRLIEKLVLTALVEMRTPPETLAKLAASSAKVIFASRLSRSFFTCQIVRVSLKSQNCGSLVLTPHAFVMNSPQNLSL
jgi:hypothetical protein